MSAAQIPLYLLNFIFYAPGGLELAWCIVFFFAYFVVRRSFQSQMIPRSLFFSFALLFLGFSLLIHLISDEFRPLLSFTYFLIAAFSFFAQKSKKKWIHLFSPFAIAAIYALCAWQFTFVEREVTMPATWEIVAQEKQEPGIPQEPTLITFHLGHGDSTSIYSDDVAKTLNEKKDPQASLQVILLYHWGRFTAHSLDKVNGQNLITQNGFATFACANEPCTKYYFGMRGWKKGN